MQLLKFELYKIFKQKIVWIALVILLGMSYLSLAYPYSSTLEKQIYKEWEGPITEQKVERAKMEYAELMKREKERIDDEEEIYSDTEVMKLWLYQKIIMSESIEKNSNGNLKEIYLRHHTGPAQVISFVEFGSFMVLGVMLLIGLSPIYSQEYSSGVANYIFSSNKGRQPLLWAKIGAAIIYTLFAVLSWEGFNLLFNYLTHGLDGWETPIQLITLYTKAPYVESPYQLTLLQYHLIQLGIHLSGAIGLALLIVFISSLCKNSLTTFFISGFIFIAPELQGVEWGILLKITYASVLRVQFLFEQFNTVDILGYSITYPVFAVILMLVLSLISVGLSIQVIQKKEITS